VRGWIAYREHPREAVANITCSQWIEADIAEQASRLSPEEAVIARVPVDFDFVQTVTLADYVAAMGRRRTLVIHRDSRVPHCD
jgi:hypothetical protein